MYALVKEILDTSREKKVDVLVARDMVANTKNYEEVKAAYAVIDKYYDAITLLRRSGDEAGIEKIVTLHSSGDIAGVEAFVAELLESEE